MSKDSFIDGYIQSDYSNYSSEDELIDDVDDGLLDGIEYDMTDSSDIEYEPENITPYSKNDEIIKDFENQYRDFFKATFLTARAKYLITQFINKDKFKKITLEKKCEIIHISRKTLFHYRTKDMTEEKQKQRIKSRGRHPKLSDSDLIKFFKECEEMRSYKLAVTTN